VRRFDFMVIRTEQSSKAERERAAAVERLVQEGASRLTAARIVEIERSAGEAGRARTHAMSRRA
jgi:hypothetical protein